MQIHSDKPTRCRLDDRIQVPSRPEFLVSQSRMYIFLTVPLMDHSNGADDFHQTTEKPHNMEKLRGGWSHEAILTNIEGSYVG